MEVKLVKTKTNNEQLYASQDFFYNHQIRLHVAMLTTLHCTLPMHNYMHAAYHT